MCIAAPGKVIKIDGKKATVEYPGNEARQAFVSDEKVKVGSYVLVQMGIIIQVLNKSEAKISQKAWN